MRDTATVVVAVAFVLLVRRALYMAGGDVRAYAEWAVAVLAAAGLLAKAYEQARTTWRQGHYTKGHADEIERLIRQPGGPARRGGAPPRMATTLSRPRHGSARGMRSGPSMPPESFRSCAGRALYRRPSVAS